jgi:hypothetical protein
MAVRWRAAQESNLFDRSGVMYRTASHQERKDPSLLAALAHLQCFYTRRPFPALDVHPAKGLTQKVTPVFTTAFSLMRVSVGVTAPVDWVSPNCVVYVWMRQSARGGGGGGKCAARICS